MILISIPAAVLTVASYKRTPYIKALAVIFIGAAVVGGASFYIFGLATPKAPSSQTNAGGGGGNATTPTQTATQPPPKLSQIVKVSILPGASAQGNPNFDPKSLSVKKGVGIQWTNNDNVPHTVTSFKDAGKSFDSSIIKSKGTFTLDTAKLGQQEYDYFCTIHPFMKAKFTIGGAGGGGNTAANASSSSKS
jgi:plastocyanin